MGNCNSELAFSGGLEPGVPLAKSITLQSGETVEYPDYLAVDKVWSITVSDKLDPVRLPVRCALIHDDNIYITDCAGNVANIRCRLKHVPKTADIRRAHREYRSVGGARATHAGMDAGHFGLSLGQHPSIAMEQNSIMNRYGAWRELERDWEGLLRDGHEVIVRGVFADGDGGTYSPFWCIEEIVDGGEPFEYVLTNDGDQS